MENGGERPEVRRAMESGGERRAMENGRPEVRRAMEKGGERRVMKNGVERKPRFATELVMCSTCSGFVMRKKRTAISIDPDDELAGFVTWEKPTANPEVVEVVKEAGKMRDLTHAVLQHGPFQEMEPAEATKEQWQVLRRRRMIMMETKRCPACSRSLLEMCPTCSRSLSEKPGSDVEDKAARSKEKKKSSREEGSELMAVLPSQGGKERKKIATEDEVMVANARSVKKSKRSRKEGKRSSSGLKKKKKAKSGDKEGSGSKKKAKRSSEMEGSGSIEEVGTEGSGSIEEVETEGSGSKEAKLSGGNGKTKMVTRRLDKMQVYCFLNDGRPSKPFTCTDPNPFLESLIAEETARYEVDCEFREYLYRQCIIRGHAEFQVEVPDDEDE